MAIRTRNTFGSWLTVSLTITPLLLTPFLPASGKSDLTAGCPPDPPQQAAITLPRILPDPMPCAYRYEVIVQSSNHPDATRDTIEVIFLRSLGNVVAAYAPLDRSYEESEKQTARGTGWIVDNLHGFNLIVETDRGLQIDEYFSFSRTRKDTLAAGIVLPREVWVGLAWQSSFGDSSRVTSVEEVEFQGNRHTGVEIFTWTHFGFAEKKTSQLWIPGIGMVRERHDWMSVDCEYRLLEVIPASEPERVQSLDLRAAHDAGCSFPELARFSSVRTLKTYLDTLQDADIPMLNVFPRLQKLDLANMSLTGISFHELRLPDLRELALPGSTIQDRYLKDLPNLSGLEVLDLRSTPVTDKGMESLIAAVHLRELYLGGRYRRDMLMNLPAQPRQSDLPPNGSITDESCVYLARLPELRTLNLADTYVTDAGIWMLRGLRGLKSLNLSNTRITDRSLAIIAHLPALEELALTHTLITDRGLWYLRDMSSLRTLSLVDCAISDSGLAFLEGHTGLTRLYLSGCRVSDRCVPSLLSIPGLAHLEALGTRMTAEAQSALSIHPATKLVHIVPGHSDFLDLFRSIPSVTMAHTRGSAPDSELAQRHTLGQDKPTFTILPENPPLGYRYLVNRSLSGAVSQVDTLISVVLKPFHEVPIQPSYPFHPDTLETEPMTETGAGWQIIDVYGNLAYWIETPTGLFSAFDVGGPSEEPAIGSLMVAAHPDTNMDWALYYDAHVTVDDTSQVTVLNRTWPGQRTSMNHRGEDAVRQWALGLGLVSETYRPPNSYSRHEMTLLDTLGQTQAGQIHQLCLRDLEIDDDGLAWFTRFDGIEELDLSNAEISDRVLPLLAGFPRLKALDLVGCEISGEGFRDVSLLPALVELDVSGTRVSDATLGLLPNLGSLRSLNLCNTYITDAGLRVLSGATTLEVLKIGNDRAMYVSDVHPRDVGMNGGMNAAMRTFIQGDGFRHLADLSGLKVLDLSGTDLDEKYLVDLLELKSLEEIDLSYTMITDEAVRILAGLPNLRSLHVGRTNVGDGAIPALLSMSHLEELDLGGTTVTDSTIVALKQMRSLRALYLQEVTLTEQSRDTLVTMDNLEILVLPWLPWNNEVRDALPKTRVYPIWP